MSARRYRSFHPSRRQRPLAFETLDQRALLATLTVGATGQFSTLQAAVNNARPDDIIQVEATGVTDLSGSVNLSLMGSAVASTPGNLTIRGTSSGGAIQTNLVSPGGPAFFNSGAFAGNLRLESLNITAATATALTDAGLVLTNFTGALTLVDVHVIDAVDVGIEITNSSGTFLIDQSEVRRNDTALTPAGIRITNFSGSGTVRETTIADVTDVGISVAMSTAQTLTLVVMQNTIGSSGGGETVGNDGIRIAASNAAVIQATISGNNFDELPGNSIDIAVANTAQVAGQFGQNTIVNSEGLVRLANEPAVRFGTRDTSSLALNVEGNTLGGVAGDGIVVQALGTSRISANLVDNLLSNVGLAADHEGILITSDSTSSATLNILVAENPIVSPFGNAIRVLGVGNSTFNVSALSNFVFYSDPGGVGMPAVYSATAAGISFEAPSGTGNTPKLNLRISGNEVTIPTDPNIAKPSTIRVSRNTSQATVKVEYVGNGLADWLFANNFVTTLQSISISNFDASVGRQPLDTFLSTQPLVIGNRVWSDTNKNALRSDTEPGVAGAILTLTGTESVGGAQVQRTVVSDGEGSYAFGGLFAGTYTIVITPPAGLDLTGFDRGLDDTVDSDFRQGIRKANVTLTTGQSNRTVDAGLIPTDGRIWKNQAFKEDVNDNGTADPLDALLIIIDLNANQSRLLPAPTDAFKPQPFLDVDGDGQVTPVDVLLVIIRLNTQSSGGGGEPPPAAAASAGESSAPGYFPPEYFYGSANSNAKTTSGDDDKTDALDAFFADY